MKWIYVALIVAFLYLFFRLKELWDTVRWRRVQEKLFAKDIMMTPADPGTELHSCPGSTYYGTYFVIGPAQRYCLDKMEARGRGTIYLYREYIGFKHLLQEYPFYIPCQAVYQVEKGKRFWGPVIVVYWKRDGYQLRSVFGSREKTIRECFNHLQKYFLAKRTKR